jgi:4'-phosphopantetheinyl transferase
MPSATLWLLDGSRVAEVDVAFFVQQLGESEARRYLCFKRKERQRQFLLARMLLRLAVAKLMMLPPDTLGVVERDSNAPQLVLPNEKCMQPAFSISHSRGWVACAVSSNASLGVDIEVESSARDIIGISQSAFHPSDHLWLLRQSETARLAAFYHLWCTREALYKLMSSLGSETGLSPLVGANGAFASQGPGWHRYTLPHSFLRVAVCSDRPLASIYKVELTRLARAEWLVAERESRSTSVATLPRKHGSNAAVSRLHA